MSTRLLRGLIGLAIIATLLWGGYWYVASRALDAGLSRVLASGGPLSAESHSVRGFPNRFDITLAEPRLQDGDASWSAPFLQLFALSYRPHHLIAVADNRQELDLGGGAPRLALTTSDARASLLLQPTNALALSQASVVLQDLEITLPDAPEFGPSRMDAARAAIRPLAGAAEGLSLYDVVIELEGITPDRNLAAAFASSDMIPPHFNLLRLGAELEFASPLDMHAASGAGPELRRATLTEARYSAGEIDLQAEMRLTASATGALNGPVTLTIDGWQALLERLQQHGMVDATMAGWIAQTARNMADPATPNRFVASVSVEEGDVRLGPLLLGSLPPLF